jgi:hypothetical protein
MEYYSVFNKHSAEHFMYYQEKYLSYKIWDPINLAKASELDGICAYDNPEEALNFGKLYNDFVVF